ncbi:protein SSUH2 homolog [Theristicus caerulescens]
MRHFSCCGEGWVPCAWCGMKGLLLYHLELTITWKNSVAEHSSVTCLETTEHTDKHAVKLIPLAGTEYEWKWKAYSFYVFGNEKQVYAEDYLGKCCCTIL